MKKLLYPGLMFFVIIVLYSCTTNKEGDWKDNIKLSTKTVEFNAFTDSVIITTEGSSWWITDVAVNDTVFYDFTNIDQESESYIIQQDCFFIERRDKRTLFVKLEENPLDIQRIVTIGLEAGDYFDRITINQKPRP